MNSDVTYSDRIKITMMTWKLHHNTILTGVLDYYCLTCEQHFKCAKEADGHLSNAEHITNLQNAKYLTKYENHGIRQFNVGYHCQFCNKLNPTLLQVKAHVTETTHIQNMLYKSARRVNNDTKVVINDIVIDDNSWHGVIDNSCVICNKDVNPYEHIVDKEHILNLIRNEVQSDSSGNVFRKLQHNDVQCLSCNILLDSELAKSHFEQSAHKAGLIKHPTSASNDLVKQDSLNQDVINENIKTDSLVQTDSSKTISEDDVEKPTDDEPTTGKEDDENYGQNMQLVKVSNKDHIQPNEDTNVINEEDVQTFAKKNKIILTENKQATCKVCKKTISSALKCLKEHVSGAKHKNKLENFQQENIKEPIQDFTERKYNKVESYDYLENSLVLGDGYIFLDEFALPFENFHIVTSVINSKRCQVCEENFSPDQSEAHCDKRKHMGKLQRVPVITNFPSDFFREIRRDIFHCGFCNCLIVGSHMIHSHKSSLEHQIERFQAIEKYQKDLDVVTRVRELRKARTFMRTMQFLDLLSSL